MQRFAPYVETAIAVVISILLIIFSGGVTVPSTPAPVAQKTTSTLSVVTNVTLPPITLPDLQPRETATTPATTRATTIPKPVPNTTPKPVPVPQPPTESIPLNSSAALLRSALVNIICYAQTGSNLHSISGSGVIIDPKGIILTNAHIAQYFLLYDRNVSCTIRTGSPASDSYKASLMYISPTWIQANKDILTKNSPIGTGEYDFALLAVTRSATANTLPSSFSSVPLATEPPNIGTSVTIASYGAQSLEPNQIQSSLFPTVVSGSVKDVYTFASTTIDVLDLGGSAAAQEGSSGGGIADASGELVGTITTSTIQGDITSRSLDAITASYIRAEYARETGQSLDLLLAQPTTTSVAEFAPKIPTLESIITAQLSN